MRARSILLALIALFLVACGTEKPVVKHVAPPPPKPAFEHYNNGISLLSGEGADAEAARAQLELAVERAAEEGEGSKDIAVQSHYNLALIYQQQGDGAKAVEHFSKAIEANPEDPQARLTFGRILLSGDKPQEAAEQFKAVLAQDFNNIDAQNGMAMAMLALGDSPKSESMLKEVMTLDSKNVTGLNTLGMLYLNLEKYAVAEYVLTRAYNEDKTNAHVINNLGLIAFRTSKIPKAVNLFTEAIAADEDFVPARLNLGAIQLDFLNYGDALQHFEKAYEIEPANPVALLGYAASLYGGQRYEEAAKHYALYHERYPESPQPLPRLALLYQNHLQDNAKACEWYKKWAKVETTDKNVSAMRDFVCSEAGAG